MGNQVCTVSCDRDDEGAFNADGMKHNHIKRYPKERRIESGMGTNMNSPVGLAEGMTSKVKFLRERRANKFDEDEIQSLDLVLDPNAANAKGNKHKFFKQLIAASPRNSQFKAMSFSMGSNNNQSILSQALSQSQNMSSKISFRLST